MKTFEVAVRPMEGLESAAMVSLNGYLDAHTVAEFDRCTEALIGEGTSKLILDLQGLSYISSAGIGALMSLSQRLRKDGGDLVLLQPTPKVLKILDLLGFTRIFQLSETEDEARAALQA